MVESPVIGAMPCAIDNSLIVFPMPLFFVNFSISAIAYLHNDAILSLLAAFFFSAYLCYSSLPSFLQPSDRSRPIPFSFFSPSGCKKPKRIAVSRHRVDCASFNPLSTQINPECVPRLSHSMCNG